MSPSWYRVDVSLWRSCRPCIVCSQHRRSRRQRPHSARRSGLLSHRPSHDHKRRPHLRNTLQRQRRRRRRRRPPQPLPSPVPPRPAQRRRVCPPLVRLLQSPVSTGWPSFQTAPLLPPRRPQQQQHPSRRWLLPHRWCSRRYRRRRHRPGSHLPVRRRRCQPQPSLAAGPAQTVPPRPCPLLQQRPQPQPQPCQRRTRHAWPCPTACPWQRSARWGPPACRLRRRVASSASACGRRSRRW